MAENTIEHALIVRFADYEQGFRTPESGGLAGLLALEDQLSAALQDSKTGELDGNEIAVDGSEGRIFMYGPDAEKMFAAVERILRTSEVTKGGEAMLRFGAVEDLSTVCRTLPL